MSSTTVKWSYSGLKQYLNCPKQYHEVKVLRNYDINVTEQMRYGTEVHSALEDYAAAQIPLAKNYLRYKPVMDELASIDGAHYNEYRMALTVDRLACDFNDANYWVRGIADKIIVDEDLAYVIDYKTGSNRYPDPKQLQLMSLMLFVHFPDVKNIKAGLLFVAHNTFVTREYKHTDIPKLWEDFAGDLERLQGSLDNNSWPCNPTPLCGWCPVKQCEFHKER